MHFTVSFKNDSLFGVYISDDYWSGIFADFDPVNFGFIKIKDEFENIDNLYPNALVEIFQNRNVKMSFRNGRHGFLWMTKE